MNQSVEPVTPEVACDSFGDVRTSPDMSEMVEKFIQLTKSLQKQGISSDMTPELQSQLRNYSSHERESDVGLHGRRRRSPGYPRTSHPREPQQPGGSDATREEARQLLHTLLSQATSGLHKNLSSKSGRLASTRSLEQSSCDQNLPSQDLQVFRNPRSSASAGKLQFQSGLAAAAGISAAEGQVAKWQHVWHDRQEIHAAAGIPAVPSQAVRNVQGHPPEVPISADLNTPFSEGSHQSITTRPARANQATTSPVRACTHDHALQMLDVTRTSIAKDKERKAGACGLTQPVHVEQGCQYLGVCTWDRSPQRRPANFDLLHGYRSQYGMPGQGASSPPTMLAKWVPGGRNQQTFNKFAAEQAHVAVSQKTSTGCFSARTAPLFSSKPANKLEMKHASVPCTSPRAMHLPSAADALRGQPRCHRAFLSPSSTFMGSSTRASQPLHTSPRSAPYLDLALPQDRLRYDAHVAREEGHTTNTQPWNATRRSISSSPTLLAAMTTAVAHTSASTKLNSRDPSDEHGRPPKGASHAPTRWDPCSSLDASQLEHLRSSHRGDSLSASGLVEFHSPESPDASMQSQMHDGNAVGDMEAAQSSTVNQTGMHCVQPLAPANAAKSAQDGICRNVAAQEFVDVLSMACRTSQDMHQFMGTEEDQAASPEALTAHESEQDFGNVQSSAASSRHTEISEPQLHTEQAHQVEYGETGPSSTTELASRQCHSAPTNPSHPQSHPTVQANLPAAASQLPDCGGVRQHLDRACALIDFVNLSVEELQRQMHCGCSHVCSPESGAERMPLPHEQEFRTALDGLLA